MFLGRCVEKISTKVNCNIKIFEKLKYLCSSFTICKRDHASCPPCGPDLVPKPNISTKAFVNEPVLCYLSCSAERVDLECAISKLCCPIADIPIMIGDEEIRMETVQYQVSPFDHNTRVARYYLADTDTIKKAIRSSKGMQRTWDKTSWEDRVRIFEKAADLIAGSFRQKLNAATMLGQGKTIHQAEIDAACETVDFIRYSCYCLSDILKYQPMSPSPELWKNFYRYRGFEGFWAAITPFNFTSIASNLATTPILMGNSVVWKPANTSMLSNWIIYKAFREAGLPPGVLNFVPAEGKMFGEVVTSCPDLAGINFTGSTGTFNQLYTQVASNLENFRNYPRLVGELGGKNFHFVHPTADCNVVVNETIRGAYEYSGQKCSACSLLYVPSSMYCTIKSMMQEAIDRINVCHPTNYTSFMSAVIDRNAFEKVKGYIDFAQSCCNTEVLVGGCCDCNVGYYIEPTLILCNDKKNKLMKEEIFGPVLTMYIYNECEIDSVMESIAAENPYALTASVFAQDEEFLNTAMLSFKPVAGNIYINEKCTGAVVGQQPFGGTRKSGTNDKAGGPNYLLRYANPQTVKRNFVYLSDFIYPVMCN